MAQPRQQAGLGRVTSLLGSAVREFFGDGCARLAAAMAYYTVFSLPALLLLVVQLAGLAVGRGLASEEIGRQVAAWIGPSAGETVEALIADARLGAADSGLATTLGVLLLLFTATGAFTQLQVALNRAWGVAPDPGAGRVRRFLVKRLLSLLLIGLVALLLLGSLLAGALLSVFGDYLGAVLIAPVSRGVLLGIESAVGLVLATLLFAVVFKVLPDARIRWRDVGVGVLVTASLFVAGKWLLGLYLADSRVASAYGAAGSLAVLLAWVYYTSMIVLFGAELTQSWARHFGAGIEPEVGAVRVVVEERRVA